MSTLCLRCGKPMGEQQVDTIPARFCCECKAMLLRHADLIQLIEQSWRFVPEKDALDKQFHPVQSQLTETVLACPDCSQPMEEYGYMGWKAIPIHRCDRCSLVWLDSDALQNMVLALAKSHYRSVAGEHDTSSSLDLADLGVEIAANRNRMEYYMWLDFEQKLGVSVLAYGEQALASMLLQLVLRL